MYYTAKKYQLSQDHYTLGPGLGESLWYKPLKNTNGGYNMLNMNFSET